jgi:hypothetical protein
MWRWFRRAEPRAPKIICMVCRKPGVHFYVNQNDGWPDFTCFKPGERDRFLREWDYYDDEEGS